MPIDGLLKAEYRELFESLYPTETQRFSSKSQLIRDMFEDIEKAKSNGVKLVSLHHVIKEKSGLSISYNEFKQILYRIRKERGHQPKTKQHQETITPHVEPVITNDNNQVYDQLIEQYNQCKNQVDKYIVLGGKREDIEHLPIGKQRDIVMKLRSSLRIKLKGTY